MKHRELWATPLFGRKRFHKSVALLLLAGGVVSFGASLARAATVTLQNGNASATIDPQSQSGQSSYVVNGVNTVNQDWFWYRVGDSGPEQSIDTLSLVSATPSAADPSYPSENNVLDLEYAGAGFDLSVQYVLEGGTPSSLNTIVSITNNGSSDLDFHLFEYGDMTLTNGTPKTDQLAITGGNTVDQTGNVGSINLVGLTGPSEVQASLGAAIKDSLNDGNPTTLNGDSGPIAGDVNFAFEWDATIASQDSYIASQATTLYVCTNAIPLPKAAWMTLAGLAGGAILLRRRLANPI